MYGIFFCVMCFSKYVDMFLKKDKPSFSLSVDYIGRRLTLTLTMEYKKSPILFMIKSYNNIKIFKDESLSLFSCVGRVQEHYEACFFLY